MRGLSPLLRWALGPTEDTCRTPEQEQAVEEALARGLLVWRCACGGVPDPRCPNGCRFQRTVNTPAGDLAFRLDALARGAA